MEILFKKLPPNILLVLSLLAPLVVFAADPTPGEWNLNAVTPSSVTAGSFGGATSFTVSAEGTNFEKNAHINIDGIPKETMWLNDATLSTSLLSSIAAGSYAITVTNFGATSSPITFTVHPPQNPVPSISKLDPQSINAGGEEFTLTISGENFLENSTVYFDQIPMQTKPKTQNEVSATIPKTAITTSKTVNVAVKNPEPGGGESGAAQFTITGASGQPPMTAGTGELVLQQSGGGNPQYSIVQDNSPDNPEAGQATNQLPAGSYTITQTLDAGWMLQDVVCTKDDGSQTGNMSDQAGAAQNDGVSGVEVKDQHTTTCSFTNTQDPNSPDGGTITFTMTVSSGENASIIQITDQQNLVIAPVMLPISSSGSVGSASKTLPAGSYGYTIDWPISAQTCSLGDTASPNTSTGTPNGNGQDGVIIMSGKTTTCSFQTTSNGSSEMTGGDSYSDQTIPDSEEPPRQEEW